MALLILQAIANLQNFMRNKQRNVQYFENFTKSSFSDVTKLRNAGLLMVAVKRI